MLQVVCIYLQKQINSVCSNNYDHFSITQNLQVRLYLQCSMVMEAENVANI